MPAAPNTEETAVLMGETIRDARVRLDITKAEAARRAGVSRRTWHEIEEGQRAVSMPETLSQIDQVLGFPEGTLYAMTTRSSHAHIEELRRRAMALVRIMSSDELDLFVANHGRGTLRARLDSLDADIRAMRDELRAGSGDSPPRGSPHPRRAPRPSSPDTA